MYSSTKYPFVAVYCIHFTHTCFTLLTVGHSSYHSVSVYAFITFIHGQSVIICLLNYHSCTWKVDRQDKTRQAKQDDDGGWKINDFVRPLPYDVDANWSYSSAPIRPWIHWWVLRGLGWIGSVGGHFFSSA